MSQSKNVEAKKPAPATTSSPFRRLLKAHARRLFLLTLLCAATGGGIYALWRSVAHDVLHHDQYRLTLDQLTITPSPPWLHTTDVREQVFREGGLANNVWLHDPHLAEQVSKTFELHPWVAKVKRVRVRGAKIDIDLEYRRPVCMVEVAPGLVQPVDVEGVILPRDDFTPAEARRYPRLAGVTRMPVGLVGEPWGDLHVVGGAEIAAALADCWEQLRLDHIGVVTTGTPEILFELAVRSGTSHAADKITWGHAPNTSEPNEPTVEQKIARLKVFLDDGTTEAVSAGRRDLDLRHASAPHTAMNPEDTGTVVQ
jgi:hypothetical protein